MLLLNTAIDIGILKTILILKYAFNITLIILPLIFMFFCFKELASLVINPKETSKSLKSLVYRLICCLIVFILPTVINYAFTLLEDFDENKLIYYYNNATLEKIKSAELQLEKATEIERISNAADIKESVSKKQEQETKKANAIKQAREEEAAREAALEQNQNNNTGTSNGNTSNNSSNNNNQSNTQTNTTPYYEGKNDGTIDSSCGNRAQHQIVTYNGQTLGQDAQITMKKGETITLKVNVTQRCGTVKQLVRTSADGQSDWKNYFNQKSVPYVNRNNSSTFRNTDTYNWVITANKTTKGYVILSQTAEHTTPSKGQIKSMIRIRIKVTN